MVLDVEKAAAPARRWQTTAGDHRFFTVMAIVSALTIAAGFASTYGPKVVAGDPALLPVIHLHALVFTAWLVVFVAQTTLVLNGRTAVHRRLGVAAVTLAGVMFVVGTWTAIAAARAGHRGIPGVEFETVEGFLLLNLGSIAVFAALVGAGWFFRRSLQTHKRLMFMATMAALVGPGVSRLPFASGNAAVIGLVVLAFLLAGPAYDLITRRRVHPAYLWSLVPAMLIVPPVVAALAATPAWRLVSARLLAGV